MIEAKRLSGSKLRERSKNKSSRRRSGSSVASEASIDLKSLGIELDEDIIERLKENLGVEALFTVANKASQLRDIVRESERSNPIHQDSKENHKKYVKGHVHGHGNGNGSKKILKNSSEYWNYHEKDHEDDPPVVYRNVSNSGDSKNDLYNNAFLNSLNGDGDFYHDDPHIHKKFSTILLKELEDTDSLCIHIEPQHRVNIEKLVETLTVCIVYLFSFT